MSQINGQNLIQFLIFGLRAIFYLKHELLGMWPNLGRTTSTDFIFNFLPIFPVKYDRVDKALVFFIGPMPSNCFFSWDGVFAFLRIL